MVEVVLGNRKGGLMLKKQGKPFQVVGVAWAKAQREELKRFSVECLLDWVRELRG